jgi:hypothetical protein
MRAKNRIAFTVIKAAMIDICGLVEFAHQLESALKHDFDDSGEPCSVQTSREGPTRAMFEGDIKWYVVNGKTTMALQYASPEMGHPKASFPLGWPETSAIALDCATNDLPFAERVANITVMLSELNRIQNQTVTAAIEVAIANLCSFSAVEGVIWYPLFGPFLCCCCCFCCCCCCCCHSFGLRGCTSHAHT